MDLQTQLQREAYALIPRLMAFDFEDFNGCGIATSGEYEVTISVMSAAFRAEIEKASPDPPMPLHDIGLSDFELRIMAVVSRKEPMWADAIAKRLGTENSDYLRKKLNNLHKLKFIWKDYDGYIPAD